MRSEKEIRARIMAITKDDRYKAKPARVDVNAPLALIQVEGDSTVAALEWALGKRERCAGSYDMPPEVPR